MRWMTRHVPLLVWLALLAAGLRSAPTGVADAWRGMTTDLLRPGLEGLRWTQQTLHELAENRNAIAGDRANREARELRERVARLQDELQLAVARSALHAEAGTSSDPAGLAVYVPEASARLLVPQLLQVGVLGTAAATEWRQGLYLSGGGVQGLRESSLVLSDVRPLIDYGRDGGVAAEDPLLLGRQVIGKVARTGHWSSTVLLLTDAGYRGRAQLVRATSQGPVFAAPGILHGTGEPTCSLEGIPSTESVRVGDFVYTAERDGVIPVPLYYGKVVEATASPDDREWTIRVEPATLPAELTRVAVLRTLLNPDRPLAN
jgi:rod shape-determining protein MreC